uniref:Uncharacterized protein n=1 Tax=Anguilla anguilla TaxID=7936 RepID=A0A0E9RA56_ANGAN
MRIYVCMFMKMTSDHITDTLLHIYSHKLVVGTASICKHLPHRN